MHLRKYWILVLLVNLVALESRAQASCATIDSNRLKKTASEMARTFLEGDYQKFITYTYPKVVQMMGGEVKMLALLKGGMEQMKREGYAFKAVAINLTPHIAAAGTEIHALVEQSIVMSIPEGELTANSFLLAVTSDRGENWHFVDTAPLHDEATLKSIFPHYNQQLLIPEKQAPIFKKE